jgi:6,7-dimethyl-8-ribityllumazine synthase
VSKTYEGKLLADGLRFGIVASRFNELITSRLLSGALDALKRHGAADENIEIAWTPGGFELPMVAHRLAESGKYDAVICLGAIIRGATPHFDYVASETAKGIAQVSPGNRGADAAASAIEMANLLRELPKKS